MGTFGISRPWRFDDGRDQSRWPLPRIGHTWTGCGSEQRLQRASALHLVEKLSKDPLRTCGLQSCWCLCPLWISWGQSGQSLSVIFAKAMLVARDCLCLAGEGLGSPPECWNTRSTTWYLMVGLDVMADGNPDSTAVGLQLPTLLGEARSFWWIPGGRFSSPILMGLPLSSEKRWPIFRN